MSSMQTKAWFYRSNGQDFGPFDPDGITERARSGEIAPDTPVRRQGGEYSEASSFDFIAAAFGDAAAPNSIEDSTPAPSSHAAGKPTQDRSRHDEAAAPLPKNRSLATTVEPTEPGNKIEVPYGLRVAWGWTLLIGAYLLFIVEQPRYGLAALSPQNLPFTIALLSFSILMLAVPTLPVAIAEWRRSRSPVAGSLVAVLALIVALLFAKVCRPPEVVPGFGWSGSPPQREEFREAISRVEDRYNKLVSRGGDESNDATDKDISGEEAASPGVVGEIERFLMETMDVATAAHNDYVRELETIGWHTILDANRLRDDNNFTESRALLKSAKGVVQRHRARASSLLQTLESRIPNFSVDPVRKAKMSLAFDESVKAWQPKADMIWELEAKTISEFEKIIDLLETRAGSWSVVDEGLVFQFGPDADKCNAHLSNIQQYAAEQERIRKQAQEASQSGLAEMKQ